MFLSQQHADILWMLVAAALVMLMQGGFCLLESGFARAKNSINVAIKNAVDFSISVLLFWCFGFGLMFGTSLNGFVGGDHFLLDAGADPWLLAFFLFQVVFCGTATTIISGAIAERARFSGYLVITAVVSGVMYPVFGHWAWGGVLPGTSTGWLASRGFVDFAGSTVVHSVGGWSALAAAIVVGPRLGRFSVKRTGINGHNLPMATIGTLMLWFGWFGFNGGSTLSVNDTIPLVLLNTNLSAAAGGLTALALSWWRERRPSVGEMLNGIIAGLVGVTAGCHVLSPAGAVAVGAVAAVVCFVGTWLLERLRIDDVIGAVPAHAMAGAWGTLAVALLGRAEAFGTGLGRWEQLQVQALGVGVCFAWSFGVGLALFATLNVILPLRVSRRAEREGLNVAEHGASTELTDLLVRMNGHRERGEFTAVDVEPHTEVGQIAAQYNRVLDRVSEEMGHRESAMLAARAAEEKYRGIFENAVEGIFRSTPRGRVLDANPALARLLGFDSPRQLLAVVGDVGAQVYVDPDRRAEFVELVERVGTVTDFESVVRRADGEEITISENARVVRDDQGRVMYYEGSVEDVTQRRVAEELEREKEAAHARDRAKSAFLANMSHEIRTPLNGVVGMLELLARTSLDERQNRFVRIATSSAGALLSLINDILDFSKIEAGKLELEHIEFDLPVLLEDVAEMFGHQALEKGIELTCFVRPDVPKRVLGDPERLRQILVNLTSNALKFTEAGEIRLEASREGTEPFVRLTVADSGIGIPHNRQLELFSPFSQLDASTTRRYGGTGLGLAICGQLADLMGGGMSVDSTPGVGSTFACSVPLVPVAVGRPARQDLRGTRVIAVDDNETNREILTEQLSAWGVDIDVHEDPFAVLEHLESDADADRPYALAILDQHMPGMNGVDLARAIRERCGSRNLKIAILSSVDDVIDRVNAAAIGIQATMTKPIRQSRLFDTLAGLLRSERIASEAAESTRGGRKLSGRVLVAEDNDVNQLVIREILEEFGLGCEVVPNGGRAVDRLEQETFDVVLMDCQMPVMDGFEATRTIREREEDGRLERRTPIVALTANAVKGDRERCLDAGMDDYVTKPVDPMLLLERLAQWLPECAADEEADESEEPLDRLAEVSLAAASTGVEAEDASLEKSPFEEAAETDPVEPPLDLPSLRTRCLDKIDLVQRVLGKFADRLPGDLNALSAALAAGEMETARRRAHGLKGAAGNVSAVECAEHAAGIETAAAAGDLVGVRVGLEGLTRAVDRCREWIGDALNSALESTGAGHRVPNGNAVMETSE